jgi:hypothetical protein
MRTQITDLEKFIEFLKGKNRADFSEFFMIEKCLADSANAVAAAESDKKSIEPYKSSPNKSNQSQTTVNPSKMRSTPTNKFSSENSPNFSQTMKKVLVLTQLYTFLLLTCGTRSMQKKSNQPTPNMKKDIVAKKHFGYR